MPWFFDQNEMLAILEDYEMLPIDDEMLPFLVDEQHLVWSKNQDMPLFQDISWMKCNDHLCGTQKQSHDISHFILR